MLFAADRRYWFWSLNSNFRMCCGALLQRELLDSLIDLLFGSHETAIVQVAKVYIELEIGVREEIGVKTNAAIDYLHPLHPTSTKFCTRTLW